MHFKGFFIHKHLKIIDKIERCPFQRSSLINITVKFLFSFFVRPFVSGDSFESLAIIGTS